MLINVMLIKETYTSNSFVALPKRGVWNKRRGWQNYPKLINGEC